jgi:hypothetical protein
MRRMYVWFFGSPAIPANPGAVPPTPAVPAQPGHYKALILLVVLMLCGFSYGLFRAYRYWFPATTTSTTTVTNIAAGTLPAAIAKSLQEGGGKDIYFNLKELSYADGQSGRNLTAAEKANAEAKAEEARNAKKQRAKDCREVGAALIQRAEAERAMAMAALKVAEDGRCAVNEVLAAEATARAINYQQLRREGFRLHFNGWRIEGGMVLEDAQEILPEVRTKPIVQPVVPRTTPARHPHPYPCR